MGKTRSTDADDRAVIGTAMSNLLNHSVYNAWRLVRVEKPLMAEDTRNSTHLALFC